MILLIWHEVQRIPATCYGDAHYGQGGYEIRVSEDAANERDRLGKEKALVYHFSGSPSGSGPGK